MSNSTITRERVVKEARTWIGTPWHHQGRIKGAGVDCVGLIVGTCRALGIAVEDITDYQRYPDGKTLVAELNRQLVQVKRPEPGDILLFALSRFPQHLAFYGGDTQIIHAYLNESVVETGLSPLWLRRVVAVYKIPGVE